MSALRIPSRSGRRGVVSPISSRSSSSFSVFLLALLLIVGLSSCGGGGGAPGGEPPGAPGGSDPGSGEDPPSEPPPGGEDPTGPGGEDPGDPGGPGGTTEEVGAYSVPFVVSAVSPKDAHTYQPADRLTLFAVPLARSLAVPIIDGRPALRIKGSEAWQFRLLDVWPEGTAKWALGSAVLHVGEGVDSNVDVTLGPGQSAGTDLVTDLGGRLAVDTGPLQVEVSTTSYRVFERVLVDGVELVSPGTSPGILASDIDGNLLFPADDTLVSVLHNGPASAQIRADGTLVNAAGTKVIDFTCRLEFAAGSREVKTIFTVRNASIERPQHTPLRWIELVLKLNTGADTKARFDTPLGPGTVELAPAHSAYAYQAYSNANTGGVEGNGSAYKPHIPKLDATTLAQEGWTFGYDEQVLLQTTKDETPQEGWVALWGDNGGVTCALQHAAFTWPGALETTGDGWLVAGLFTRRNPAGYTFAWRQHESRTAVFAFHSGGPQAPEEVARRLDLPALARAVDYKAYDESGCIPYDLVTLAEHNALYAALGFNHNVNIKNLSARVIRHLPAGQGGGENNHASSERRLMDEFLRAGTGGGIQRGLDEALYKSEWQIERSDDFAHVDDPGAINPELPHSTAFQGDKEHRYREGIWWAFLLTGDDRYLEALLDEVEILLDLDPNEHERSAYQTLRAMVFVADALDHTPALTDPLVAKLREHLQYIATPTLDVNTLVDGFGWEAPPGAGSRGYYVNSTQGNSEKPPGENYITRGFITATLGPLAYYHTSRYLLDDAPTDPDGLLARLRGVDLATYVEGELYPYNPVVEDRHLIYSYAVSLQQTVSETQSDFQTILLGMAEGYRHTGDIAYLVKAYEFLQALDARGHLEEVDSRLEIQHFFATLKPLLLPGN